MYRITAYDKLDLKDLREFHKLAFPKDAWPGNDHEYWIAGDEDDPVGFASAKMLTPYCAFLSSAGVRLKARKKGLHRRFIKARLTWAAQEGAHWVLSYVQLRNYQSLANLFACGFRGVEQHDFGKNWHVVVAPISGVPTQMQIDSALSLVGSPT